VVRRHAFAFLSSLFGIIAVVLLAANDNKPAVFVALAAVVLSLAGAAVTAAHKRGS
jgi:hypothetical protein